MNENLSLTKDLSILNALARIAARLTNCPAQREDLIQEALLHLWKIEQEPTKRTRSWYLQACKFRMLRELARGRSIDSLKRRVDRVAPDSLNPDDLFVCHSPVFAELVANDFVSQLSNKLSPEENATLQYLIDGLSLREVSRRLNVTHPTIMKRQRKIARLADELECHAGIEPACSGWKPDA